MVTEDGNRVTEEAGNVAEASQVLMISVGIEAQLNEEEQNPAAGLMILTSKT